MYADDSQLYVVLIPCDEKTALANLQRCIQEVREWFRENFLLFNDKKTEVVIFEKEITGKQLQIGKSVISSRSAATSLGCILDTKLNMSQHVSRVCKSANYYLHCIREIHNFISMDVCKLPGASPGFGRGGGPRLFSDLGICMSLCCAWLRHAHC